MYDQNNLLPKTTVVSHYLRTGQIISELDIQEAKQFGLNPLRHALGLYIRRKYGAPNDVLTDHYFFSSGQTFDLVARGLLPYIKRASAFQRTTNRFFELVQRDLVHDAGKLCNQPLKDYISGHAKSTKRFRKKFSDKPSINFTSEFFSLGDSYVELNLSADVKVNCITGGVEITGKISYRINDWFRDAIDIRDAIPGYQEYPFGTAYKMVAHWSQSISLSGRFR